MYSVGQAVFLATGIFEGACHFGAGQGLQCSIGKKTNWCFGYLTSKFSEPISLYKPSNAVAAAIIRLEL